MSRVTTDVASALMLAKAGVRVDSILLYPIRRRLRGGRNHIELRGGLSLDAPAEEPLLFLFREIWSADCYRLSELQVESGEVIVDIGAHVGVFAACAARRYPQARVLAVEPSPRALPFLRRNITANALRNAAVVPLACGDRCGAATLYRRGPDMMSTLYAAPGTANGSSVQVATLDRLFEDHAVERCALLKLDCEGAEYDILLGAGKATLQRVARISMECHLNRADHEPAELEHFLRSSGFDVHTVPTMDSVHLYLYASRAGPV
jgi:FkbM family methyltransferase